MLEPLQRLGDFEIIRLLGKGGMGEVYEARQSNPERRVALKVLAPWLTQNKDAVARFLREAEVPAQLDHPGVVRIISTGQSGDIAYYAMQLVRGISLSDLIRKANEPLPETLPQPTTDHSDPREHPTPAYVAGSGSTNGDLLSSDSLPPVTQQYLVDRFGTVARIGVQAARALAAAHKHGVLHRDIKPSNLMVDHHDQLYIMDFGLTRALDGGSQLTHAGALVGTPWFMSPEQANRKPIDARSDLFSLGVTLYQLASKGNGPYTASRDDSDAVLEQVRSGDLEPIADIVPEIPHRLARIITKAVEPKLQRRYQTAEELAKDLEQFLEDPNRRSTIAKPAPLALSNAIRAVVALLLIGIVTITAVLLLKRDPVQKNAPPIAKAPPEVPKPTTPPRPFNVRLPLLRVDNQPVSTGGFVFGKGTITPKAQYLFLQDSADNPAAHLVLDDVTDASFEYEVELLPVAAMKPGLHELGVFWGWREERADPRAMWRFFAARLDARPVLKDVHGRLTVGTRYFGGADEIKGAAREGLRALRSSKGLLTLRPPDPMKNGWHKITVRVVQRQITVTVDNEPSAEFDVAHVLRSDSALKAYPMDPRGLLGIWVENGHGYFRNATITLLPDQ